MATNYEEGIRYQAHLVIGCKLSQANKMGMETTHFKDYLYSEHEIIYYEESDFLGFKISVDKLNIPTIQSLGKVARKVEGILGHEVTVRAVLFSY